MEGREGERKEGRKEGSKEVRKEGRKEGRKERRRDFYLSRTLYIPNWIKNFTDYVEGLFNF